MTGKTHMAISAAAVAVLLAAGGAGTGARVSKGAPRLLPLDPGVSHPGAHTIAGLLLLGVVAGLFPDLDAPDTELQHLPDRAAKRVGRFISAGMPGHSLPGTLVQEVVRLAALPFSLTLAGAGAALRTFTGHRGFTHTLRGALTFTGLAAAAALVTTGSVPWSLAVGAVWLSGYASHLAADACTPSGIPLFGSGEHPKASWRGPTSHAGPVPTRSRPPRASAFHLLPKRMLIRTGAPADTLLVRWLSWAVFLAATVSMLIG